MRSLHKIKIEISSVSYRICRPYQERIDDFYEDGKIRFQWDMIKQAYMLGQDQTLPQICQNCPLNIYRMPEGCQGDIFGLKTFLHVLSKYKPEASILSYDMQNDTIDVSTTRQLLTDIKELEKFLDKINWPVAQVFFNNMPVSYTENDGIIRHIFYEWDGQEEESYPQGTEGYFWGRTQEGIIVKDSFGNKVPQIFKKLFKEGYGVYGEPNEGSLHAFVPVMGQFPSWEDIEPGRNSQLIATEMIASSVFGDTMNILKVFSQEALMNNTGLNIINNTG